MGTASLLEVEGLSVTFRTPTGDVTPVPEVGFTVGPGERVALVGESGCGKSVTALSLTGLPPTDRARRRGKVLFEGRDLLGDPEALRAARRGERHAHFNKLLLDKMTETLDRGEQVMLFQNRRGFSPYVECTACGWTARCPYCNVTLTYHKAGGRLVCHYCGHTETLPSECPVCHAASEYFDEVKDEPLQQ